MLLQLEYEINRTKAKKIMAKYFTKRTETIVVPELAVSLRNDCQRGQWVETSSVGDTLHCSIIDDKDFRGSLGRTTDERWKQLWLIAEKGSSEKITKNTLMVTYIKRESLESFVKLQAEVEAKGILPVEPVYIVTFKEIHKGDRNYFVLDWKTRPRTPEDNSIQDLETCYEKHNQYFNDPFREKGLTPLSANVKSNSVF